jgi:plasmid replication initiation protein
MLLQVKGYLPNQIVNASYNYSPSEINLLLTIVSAYQGGTKLELSTGYLLAGFGSSNSNNEYLRNAALELCRKPLEFYSDKKNSYIISALITSAEFNFNARKAIFTFNPDIAEILVKSKEKYTRFNFETLLRLESRYSKRLYLFCNQWRTKGVWQKDIETLRLVLALKNSYTQFNDFKTKVIEPAIRELNEKSEFKIEADFIKEGRGYKSLMLCFVLNNRKRANMARVNAVRFKAVASYKRLCIFGRTRNNTNFRTGKKKQP